jgi:hypothetical protein
MSKSWLSVGKSFKPPTHLVIVPASGGVCTEVPDQDGTEDSLFLTRKRPREIELLSSLSKSDVNLTEVKHERKHRDHKHKKSKKSKKKSSNKKSSGHRHRNKTEELHVDTLTVRKSPTAEDFTHDSSSTDQRSGDEISSSSFSGTDEEEANVERLQHKQRRFQQYSETVYLPNGQTISKHQIPAFKNSSSYHYDPAAAVQAVGTAADSWYVDTRRDSSLSEWQRGTSIHDVVQYKVVPLNIRSDLKTENTFLHNRRNHTQSLSSAQLIRNAYNRPTGLMVSSTQQRKDFDELNKTEQLFKHRATLLADFSDPRDVKLARKYRYFGPPTATLLMDPSVSRLNLASSSSSSSSSSGSSNSSDKRSGGSGGDFSGNQSTEHPSSSISSSIKVRPKKGSLVTNSMVPLPVVELATLRELGISDGFAGTDGANATARTALHDVVDGADTCGSSRWHTASFAAAERFTSCNRYFNAQLFAFPADTDTTLHFVSLQPQLAVLSSIASGTKYNPLSSAHLTGGGSKAVVEKQIAILKESIRKNQANPAGLKVLYPALIRFSILSKQPERLATLVQEYIAALPLQLAAYMQQWTLQCGSFTHSAYTDTCRSLTNIPRQLRLKSETCGIGKPTTGNHPLSLFEEMNQAHIKMNLSFMQCDVLLVRLLLEQASGHVERVFAIVQVCWFYCCSLFYLFSLEQKVILRSVFCTA